MEPKLSASKLLAFLKSIPLEDWIQYRFRGYMHLATLVNGFQVKFCMKSGSGSVGYDGNIEILKRGETFIEISLSGNGGCHHYFTTDVIHDIKASEIGRLFHSIWEQVVELCMLEQSEPVREEFYLLLNSLQANSLPKNCIPLDVSMELKLYNGEITPDEYSQFLDSCAKKAFEEIFGKYRAITKKN